MELAILIARILVQFGPMVAKEFQELFASKEPPTQAQWDRIWSLTEKQWKDYVPPPNL